MFLIIFILISYHSIIIDNVCLSNSLDVVILVYLLKHVFLIILKMFKIDNTTKGQTLLISFLGNVDILLLLSRYVHAMWWIVINCNFINAKQKFIWIIASYYRRLSANITFKKTWFSREISEIAIHDFFSIAENWC